MKKLNFCIIGVAGYIAPRHLQAIKALGHHLLLSYDPNDNVGILDRYFPKAELANLLRNMCEEKVILTMREAAALGPPLFY